MIPKKDGMCSDPEKFRPISLTSCLGKLVERLINLLFFTQKISEALNKGKKACGVFFDISKAFDKVWHKSLIHKLIRLKIQGQY